MQPKIFITSIGFNDGSRYSIPENGVTIFVGANNSGKSAALKNVYSGIQINNQIPTNHSVIPEVRFQKIGTPEQIIDLLHQTHRYFPHQAPNDYKILNHSTSKAGVMEDWTRAQSSLPFASIFAKYLSTDTRIVSSNNVEIPDYEHQMPIFPLHFLYLDDGLELQACKYFYRAFGLDLVLDRLGGRNMALHVGTRPKMQPGEDRMSSNYVGKIRGLPRLIAQGDGMRSFASIILELVVDATSSIFIDEPEAFLHPPQALLLGNIVGEHAKSRQFFIATHSSDIIKGILENENINCTIIRINREGLYNFPSQLDTDSIREIWNEPLLRFSPIIDGVFHEKVVVCESDGDCRFFTTLIHLLYEKDKRANKIFDAMFLASHGKYKMPIICRDLKKLSVPTYVICDFDIFNNSTPLKDLIEAQGGVWQDFEPKWKIFKLAVDDLKSQLDRREVLGKITQIVGESNLESLEKREVEKIKEILKVSTAWSFAKDRGISFVPAGDASSACQEIINLLKTIRIFVIPVGELESFDRSLGNGNKSKWLETVLKKDLLSDPSLRDARDFISGMVENIFSTSVEDS